MLLNRIVIIFYEVIVFEPSRVWVSWCQKNMGRLEFLVEPKNLFKLVPPNDFEISSSQDQKSLADITTPINNTRQIIGTENIPDVTRVKCLASLVTCSASTILINNLQAKSKVYFFDIGYTFTTLEPLAWECHAWNYAWELKLIPSKKSWQTQGKVRLFSWTVATRK